MTMSHKAVASIDVESGAWGGGTRARMSGEDMYRRAGLEASTAAERSARLTKRTAKHGPRDGSRSKAAENAEAAERADRDRQRCAEWLDCFA